MSDIAPMSSVSKPLLLFVACLLSLAALAAPSRSTGVFRNNQAKSLIGLKVENEDGILLGRIKNFVVDTSSGHVVYALVSSGGGLTGIGAQTRAVPASSLTPATAKRGIVCISINAKNWQRLPLHKKNDLSRLQPPAPSLALVSSLWGHNVVDSQGNSLGEIKDLLIDFSGNQPAVAITSAGRMLRKGETLAIPLNTLQPAGKNTLRANSSLTSAAGAPIFSAEHWDNKEASRSQISRFASN